VRTYFNPLWALRTCPVFGCLACISFYQAPSSTKSIVSCPNASACATRRPEPLALRSSPPALSGAMLITTPRFSFPACATHPPAHRLPVFDCATPASRRSSHRYLQMLEMSGAAGDKD
jgi:hypothetical protein